MRLIKQEKVKRILFSLILVIILMAGILTGDEIKFISIGMLQNWYSSAGCEIETGRTGENADQLDGLSFPSLYPEQDMQAQKGLWVGCKNYTDPLANNRVYNYKVVHVGPRTFVEGTQIMPVDFTMYGKFDHPSVYVDNTIASDLVYQDKDVVVDENLISDRMLYNKFNTGMGVTVTRRIYAFGQEGRDDYFIYKYTLKNTGIYDEDGNTQNQTLNDVYLFLQYRLAMSNYCGDYYYKWMPQDGTWGINTVSEVLHSEYGDDYNGFFMFHGLYSNYEIELNGGTTSGDNHGAPNGGDGTVAADGFLGGSQFPGVVTIHVDKSSDDKSNDLSKLANAPFFHSDDNLTQPPHSQFNESKMTAEYQLMTDGIPATTHAASLGYPHNPSYEDAPFPDAGDADNHPNIGAGGVSQGLSYGPYNLAPGDSVNIVIAEAVGSISWEKRIEVGDKFYYEKKPYTLPDGTTTDDVWQYKDAWVFSGRDSLLSAFDKAIETFNLWESGSNIARAPEPPSNFFVNSGGDRIALEWSSEAESYENFGGYRIYRQVGTPDTAFSLIYECGDGTGNPVVNEYEDKTAVRGFDYYYYITVVDNGQVDPDGKKLESGLFWTRSIEPANLKRPPEDNLNKIRIVPNPVNIKAVDYQFSVSSKDRLMFYNLPPQCKIKIYSERGDKIATLNHTDNSGDEEWNMNTSSWQGIVSGIYIAYIEATADYIDEDTDEVLVKKGQSVVKKFVVIK